MAKKKKGKKRKNNFIQRMVLKYRKSKKDNASVFLGGLALFYAFIIALVLLIGHNNIILAFKGYAKEDRQTILAMSREDKRDYLKYDRAINIKSWDKLDNDQHYYDYTIFQKAAKYKQKEDVIEYIDAYYELRPDLENLGYKRDYVRTIMNFVGIKDYNFIIENKITYEEALPYLEVKGVQVRDIKKYEESKKSPKDAIMSISYPFIDSRNPKSQLDHMINEPGKIDVLIKSGFVLPAYYEPNELKVVDVYRDDESTNIELRKDAAEALEAMAKDAEKKGLHLGIRSGYRSYKDQKEVYSEYVGLYGFDYASTMVALPGSSEHQLGTGVDITSLSVINGQFQTFGETEEYQWVIKNGAKYGYILRYPEDKVEITGTMNEPWHFRYVGKEIAQKCVSKNWTLEEYVIHNGFSTTLAKIE